MASPEDIAVVQRFYDEAARGNFWIGRELFDPDIRWEWAPSFGDFLGRRVCHGLREVEATTKEGFEPWERLHLELEELIDAGERIVAMTRSVGRLRGATADVTASFAEVWTVKGGRAVEFKAYEDREQALRDAGVQR